MQADTITLIVASAVVFVGLAGVCEGAERPDPFTGQSAYCIDVDKRHEPWKVKQVPCPKKQDYTALGKLLIKMFGGNNGKGKTD